MRVSHSYQHTPKKLRKMKSDGNFSLTNNSKSFDKTKHLNFQDAYRALYCKMSKSISHSFFLPSKHSSGNKTFRERDPKLFEKLHNEQLRQVKLSVRKHSMERFQKTEQELTFQPRVKSRFGKKRRSLEEFITDMVTFPLNQI